MPAIFSQHPRATTCYLLFELALRPDLHWEDLDLAIETSNIWRANSGGLTALPTKTPSSERRIALPTPCLCSL
ncbi:hypothetical protein OHA98_06140 [Streptomyces sp. NBC_00654]|uniref:hypothetical protein n=1 Tax=Streptomyces sp. NBC_00654 TaxID=2975799 RepID=UPI00224FC8AB|nr:hypothetical protein [Streptomyces sp. NBC_00654]MCX4964402.1 hypothetical protein [Streptomyces sp. NBC_00654]